MIYFENGNSVSVEHKHTPTVGTLFLEYVDIHGNTINVSLSKITHILNSKDYISLCDILPAAK